MKDKEFEKLLQESVKLYGHEYPEPLSSDLKEIHRFPDDFIDDIIPHTKPKKPFILRHIKAISAVAAVMVIGLAAVMIFSRPNADKLYKSDGIVAPTSSTNSVPESHVDENFAIEDSSPLKSTSDIKQPDSTDINNSIDYYSYNYHPYTQNYHLLSSRGGFESSFINNQGEIGESSKNTETSKNTEERENTKVYENTEVSGHTEIDDDIEESGFDFSDYSEECSYELENYALTYMYSSFYDEKSDEYKNQKIYSLLTVVKKYMTSDHLIDYYSSNFDISQVYEFKADNHQESFKIGEDEYYNITLEKTEDGYIVSATTESGLNDYFINNTEDDYKTIESTLQEIISGG